jgi:hypothetical protein
MSMRNDAFQPGRSSYPFGMLTKMVSLEAIFPVMVSG